MRRFDAREAHGGPSTLVGKMQFLTMLIEALAFEEVSVLPILDLFKRKLRASQLDEAIKEEVEEKLWKIQAETVGHAKVLTRMLKRVVEVDRDEY